MKARRLINVIQKPASGRPSFVCAAAAAMKALGDYRSAAPAVRLDRGHEASMSVTPSPGEDDAA